VAIEPESAEVTEETAATQTRDAKRHSFTSLKTANDGNQLYRNGKLLHTLVCNPTIRSELLYALRRDSVERFQEFHTR
jgi:hypothetical protein